MSELEQAKVDARRLPHMDTFIANDNGQINSPDNRQFIRQFIQNQPENLRNELLDSKGELSQTGVQRIRNAMLYQAYGDSQVLSRLIENTDQGAKNVLNALISLAPKVSQANQSINDGTLSDVGISQDIIQAVEKYNQLNAQGYKISDYLAQNDFVGDLSVEAREILAVFDENRRSGKRIAKVLGVYFDQALTQGNLSQANIFGEFAFDKLGTLQQARTAQETDDSPRFSRSALPMDIESRLGRARDMGFNTENYYTHGTYQQDPITEIKPHQSFGGLFSMQNQFGDARSEQAAFGDRYEDFIIKGEPMTHQEFRERVWESEQSVEDVKAVIAKNADIKKLSLDEEQWNTVLDLVTEDDLIYNHLESNEAPDYLKEIFKFDGETEPGYLDWGVQRMRIAIAKNYGANAVNMRDENGISVALLSGNGVRSINAAFDPSQSESNNLRYSFAGENAKTADHSSLAEAKSAVKNGVDPEIVRKQTGWFQGADDKWRFEIDDSKATFVGKNKLEQMAECSDQLIQQSPISFFS